MKKGLKQILATGLVGAGMIFSSPSYAENNLGYSIINKTFGQSKWSSEDTLYQSAYFLTHLVDWGQTRHIAKNPEYNESNTVLGKNPSISDVDRYFIVTGLTHLGVSYLLPSRANIFGRNINPRRLWQILTIGMEANSINKNISAGVEIDF